MRYTAPRLLELETELEREREERRRQEEAVIMGIDLTNIDGLRPQFGGPVTDAVKPFLS